MFSKPKNRNWIQKTAANMSTKTIAGTALALGATAAFGAGVYWATTRRAPRATFRMRREIDAPPERVLQWFATPEQLTEPMAHADVDAAGDLVWKQEGPFGFTYSWKPKVDIDPGTRELRWSSNDGSWIDAEGTVRVRATHAGKSLLEFTTDFQVPGPVWPRALHDRTRDLVAEDLERVCIALEAATHERSSSMAVAEAK